MWRITSRILDTCKRFPLFRLLYRIPGVVGAYHYSLAFFGALIYRFPSRRLFVIGVTGTKGKTTVIELIKDMLEAGGNVTASLSSYRITWGERSELNIFENTQPGRFYLQYFLRRAVQAGCTHAIVEVTSQGVTQHRHRFVRWGAGFLINLAPEHIEAHGSFENYRDAKLAFLQYVAARGGKVFINENDKNAEYFLGALLPSADVTGYSHAGLRSLGDTTNPRLLGDYNIDNIAAAVVLGRTVGVDEATMAQVIRSFAGVPGRLEFVQREPFAVVVDYAHTPDSLYSLYTTLKPEAKQLICVLGSAGGGRDAWKRPEMGKFAAQYCDTVILTNEDPYDENPEKILDEIASGFSVDSSFCNPAGSREAGRLPTSKCHRILDRKEAIKRAIKMAREGDTVAISGKGSERWIHVAGGKKIRWSDVRVAEEMLRGAKRENERIKGPRQVGSVPPRINLDT